MKANYILISALALATVPATMYSQNPPSRYSNSTSMSSSRKGMTMAQLPAAVQETVKREAAGREIAKIERKEWNGREGYRVDFQESGRNPAVYIAEDGSLIRPEEKPPGAGTLFMGTTFKSTPTAVQQTIRSEVGTGEITKIDREGPHGNRYYKVDVRDPQGASYELQIGQDGKVQHDSRQPGMPR